MIYFLMQAAYARIHKWRCRRGMCIFLLFCVMITVEGCHFSFLSDLYPPTEDTISVKQETEDSTEMEETSREEEVYVHVCGAVKNPGLYSFSQGERIDAAIQAAGGFTKDADEASVNLAEILQDGSQIEVKGRQASQSSAKQAVDDGKVNLNEADQTQLMTLSGIGESRAKAILAYREEHGSFSSIEDLKHVDGIGDGIYQKIKNDIKT